MLKTLKFPKPADKLDVIVTFPFAFSGIRKDKSGDAKIEIDKKVFEKPETIKVNR